NLSLHVDIPLLDVIPLRIRFHIRAGKRTRSHFCVCTVRIRGRNAHRPCKCRRGRIGHNTDESEWRLDALLRVVVPRKQQNIEDGEAATDGHLSITAWIPSKTESRLKIPSRGVRVIRSGAAAAWLSKYERRRRIRRSAVR